MPPGYIQKIIFLFLLLFFCSIRGSSQTLSLPFDRLTVEDGLPNPSVLDINQDRQGFMWFTSFNGVTRFDGYNMQTYYPRVGQFDALPLRSYPKWYQAPTGQIWVGLLGQPCNLYRYDPSVDRFQPFMYDTLHGKSLLPLETGVSSIFEDSKGRLLIGTYGGGLFVLEGGSYSQFMPDSLNPYSFPSFEITGPMSEDEDGNIWIPTLHGLCKWEHKTGRFRNFHFTEPREPWIDECTATRFDPPSTLWVGTVTKGLIRFDVRNETFSCYPIPPEGLDYERSVNDLAMGKDGTIWLTTSGDNGFNIFTFEPGSEKMTRVENREDPAWELLMNTICVDDAGNIWAGAWQNGVFHHDPKKGRFLRWNPLFRQSETMVHPYVTSFFEDENGIIWMGTTSHGVVAWDPGNNTFSRFPISRGGDDPDENLEIISILKAESGGFWLGTWKGIIHFDPVKNVVRPISLYWKGKNVGSKLFRTSDGKYWGLSFGFGLCQLHDDPVLGYEKCYTKMDSSQPEGIGSLVMLEEDSAGNLWFAVNQEGMLKYDPQTESFEHFMDGYGVIDIHAGREGMLWLATHSNGLKGFDPSTGKILHLDEETNEKLGLVRGILEDDKGMLWMKNSKGLVQFDPYERKVVRQWNKRNWLAELETDYVHFLPAYKTRNGAMLYGGETGAVYFHPDSLQTDSIPPKVAFSDFSLFGQSLKPGVDSPLKTHVSQAKKMMLKHWENDISFRFAALHFKNPEEYQYRYRLDPEDQDWIYIGNRNEVFFTNLNPGQYTLRVQAANTDGFWSEQGASLQITILRPWWNTWLSWAVYLGIFAAISAAIYRALLQRAENRRLKDMNVLKTRLYTNVTHEFRTPLTLILGLADKLKKGAGPPLLEHLQVIERNGQQLLGLINQLLDLATLEAGELKLKPVQSDVISFLEYLVDSFQGYAQFRKVDLYFSSEVEALNMDFDPAYLQKVVGNLLSNALKFTPEGGTIGLKALQSGENTFELVVSDTGIGIDPTELDKIFDRFYQADSTLSRKAEGTGIGLALTKELVAEMGGQIKVESELGQGSSFTIQLPVTRMAEPGPIKKPTSIAPWYEPVQDIGGQVVGNADLPLVLVVEDNADVSAYVQSCLKTDYRILQAPNGRIGLETACSRVPDLIITDVMMPKMDGFELGRKLKADERTSHIPLIILTAKADTESRLEGLELGAEAYLAKPFLREELLIRVRKLLELRRLLQSVYQKLLSQPIPDIAPPGEALDQAFILKAKEEVLKNLEDPEFRVPNLVRALGMSRTQLHRKISSLTGLSAGRFIRDIRLDQSKKLLLSTVDTVSVIAYQCGFNDPDYFSRVFQEEMGMSPTQFREKGDRQRNTSH